MEAIKAIILIDLTIFKVILGSGILFSIQEEEENLFKNINEILQDIMSKVFSLLNLSTHFTNHYETRLLLSILASLKKISESKFHIYKDVTNASKLDLHFHKLKNSSLFKLDRPINDIMEKHFVLKSHSTHARDINDIDLKSNSIEIPDDSEEAFVFLREYLYNIGNIELADIAKPSYKIKKMYEKHKQFRYAKRKNFKVWKASNLTESSELYSRRLFKGGQAKIKKFPFLASIHVKNEFTCTGSIVSRNMIITAASCLHVVFYNDKFLKENPHAIAVRVASDYPDRSGEWIEATTVFIHPNYDAATLSNNIAIVQIKKHLHLRRKSRKIRRIRYQRMKGELPNSVHEVLLLGWGDKEHRTGQISYSRLKMFKLNDCLDIYTTYVTKKNFCAGFNGKGAGACQQRDVGGPAIVSNVLVGVVSFGPPVCESAHTPTVFTNIGHHVTWINNIVEKKSSEVDPTTDKPPETFIYPPATDIDPDLSRFHLEVRNKILGYPKPMHLLSNVLKDIMLHSEHMYDDNVFEKQSQNIWRTNVTNTATITIGPVNSKTVSPTYHTQSDTLNSYNLNNYYGTNNNILRLLNHEPFRQTKIFDYYTNHRNFSLESRPEFILQTQHVLRYVTEASTKKLKKLEDSSSYSDNYESEEEMGIEIEVPSIFAPDLPSIAPFTIDVNSLHVQKPYEITPKLYPYYSTSPTQTEQLPVDFIQYIENKIAPISSQLGQPEKNYIDQAKEFLLKKYEKHQMFPISPLDTMFITMPTTRLTNDQISSEDQAEKFVGKNYLKEHNIHKAPKTSDEFVFLLLKHSTSRKKRYRHHNTDNYKGTYGDDILIEYSTPELKKPKRPRPIFKSTAGLKSYEQVNSESDNVFIINENQISKEDTLDREIASKILKEERIRFKNERKKIKKAEERREKLRKYEEKLLLFSGKSSKSEGRPEKDEIHFARPIESAENRAVYIGLEAVQSSPNLADNKEYASKDFYEQQTKFIHSNKSLKTINRTLTTSNNSNGAYTIIAARLGNDNMNNLHMSKVQLSTQMIKYDTNNFKQKKKLTKNHKAVNSSDFNYYFSSPEDLMYYRENANS